MYFRDDDDLAVHSVSHAALGIMQELLTKRGKDVHADLYDIGLFEMLKTFRRGLLDPRLSSEQSFRNYVAKIPSEIWKLIEEDEFEAARGLLVRHDLTQVWRKIKKSYNFLKHADRDPASVLDVNKLDNVQVIVYAVTAYSQLGLPPTLNMRVFTAYYCCLQSFDLPLTVWLNEMVGALRKVDMKDRRAACRFLIGDDLISVRSIDDW
jgi:hypothetical protein